jgi:hypothetical protein
VSCHFSSLLRLSSVQFACSDSVCSYLRFQHTFSQKRKVTDNHMAFEAKINRDIFLESTSSVRVISTSRMSKRAEFLLDIYRVYYQSIMRNNVLSRKRRQEVANLLTHRSSRLFCILLKRHRIRRLHGTMEGGTARKIAAA